MIRKRLQILAAAALLLFGTQAGALSLLDLDAGTSFGSSDGTLTFDFDPGSVTLTGLLNSDLSVYAIQPRVEGFRIAGPIAVADGNVGSITLDFTVTAASGLLIGGADLFLGAFAFGSGAMAAVGDFFSNGDSLATAVSGGGVNSTADSAIFAAPVKSLTVTKTFQVVTTGAGNLASISAVEENFRVELPEPRALLMMGFGLAGLAMAGSRPARRP